MAVTIAQLLLIPGPAFSHIPICSHNQTQHPAAVTALLSFGGVF